MPREGCKRLYVPGAFGEAYCQADNESEDSQEYCQQDKEEDVPSQSDVLPMRWDRGIQLTLQCLSRRTMRLTTCVVMSAVLFGCYVLPLCHLCLLCAYFLRGRCALCVCHLLERAQDVYIQKATHELKGSPAYSHAYQSTRQKPVHERCMKLDCAAIARLQRTGLATTRCLHLTNPSTTLRAPRINSTRETGLTVGDELPFWVKSEGDDNPSVLCWTAAGPYQLMTIVFGGFERARTSECAVSRQHELASYKDCGRVSQSKSSLILSCS